MPNFIPEIDDVIKLFKRKDILNGTYIIFKLGISQKNAQEFFEHFTHDIKLLEVNPGQDLASSVLIQNKFGLKPQYKRSNKIDIIVYDN